MSKKNSCVSIYPTHQATEQALGELRKAGIDLRQVSIASKAYHSDAHLIGFYNVGERICYWGQKNDIRANLRPIENVVISGGFSAFGAALYSIGIPKNCISRYEQAVIAEACLLIVHGEGEVVEQACEILHSETQQVTVHRA